MFIVTGGAGFIGSVLVWKLNQEGIDDIVIVDRLGSGPKWKNLAKRKFRQIVHKDNFSAWLAGEGSRVMIDAVFHMGASSSTTETDCDYLVANNINFSIKLFEHCAAYDIPLIYASSASTYGGGEHGFRDDPNRIDALRPMHPYGFSKQKFDQWVLAQAQQPLVWAGLKFFNVYGPQEYHKGAQTSVVYQFLPQIKRTGALRLFKSTRPDFAHGEQKRDFVSVKDCADVAWHFYRERTGVQSGIYNVGTGKARTFADLGRTVFRAAKVSPERLEFVDMPENLKDQYQYFTEADLTNLRERGGYKTAFTELEEGVTEYVQKYLLGEDAFL
jgi:ADP-L-glycero-D-manno-heptose 6-epimerase